MKYSYCLNSCKKESLPITFQAIIHQYFYELKNELAKMIHSRIISIEDMHQIIKKELAEREVVLWLRQNDSELPEEMKQDTLIRAAMNYNVCFFLEAVKEYEQFLRKHHNWKMIILGNYQRIADMMYWS